MDAAAQSSIVWSPPSISLSDPPEVVAKGRPQVDEEYPENFFRCARWCPDGSCALGQCEDRTLQVLQPSTVITENDAQSIRVDRVFRQPSPIVDFAWYPGASPSNPSSFCFLASVRECPVKLLDATDGRLRASYRIVDHRERQIAPHSLAFNCLATHLYCGYEDAIEVFDFLQPGEGTKLPTTPSKKSRDGMKGIVSSIAFCPDYSGLYAASNLASAIALFSEETGADPVGYLDGATAPITQVKFDSARPHLLYAAQRRSNEILCWDVRQPFEVLRSFARKSNETSQKLLFDIDLTGRWLATGNEDGYISIFDLHVESGEPVSRFKAHDDSVGSVAFSAIDATLLSVSGSRHLDHPPAAYHQSNVSESPLSSDVSDTSGSEEDCIRRRRQPVRPYVQDSSVKVWKFSPGDATQQNYTSTQDQTMLDDNAAV